MRILLCLLVAATVAAGAVLPDRRVTGAKETSLAQPSGSAQPLDADVNLLDLEAVADADPMGNKGTIDHDDEWRERQPGLEKIPTPLSEETGLATRNASARCWVELWSEKYFEGLHVCYTEGLYPNECINFYQEDNKAISSIKQHAHSSGRDFSCMYYAKRKCESDAGSLGKRGPWEQARLQDQPKQGSGTWDNTIWSARCWFIKTDENTNSTAIE